MMPEFLENERIADLLVQQATEGLSAGEARELRALLATHDRPDYEVVERTAAALLLAGSITPEPLPATLRRKLDLAAHAFAAGEFGQPANAPQIEASRIAVTAAPPRPTLRTREWTGWFAAAACLVLALLAWWPRWQTADDADQANLTAAEARAQLIADPAVIREEWRTTEDPAARGVTGDVVWDNDRQIGYLRFRGLPVNDVARSQYQLWIFDGQRGDQFPVDGGVFDVPSGADEVVIAIDPKLPVADPRLFAVTIERPGGVVVSSRERIVVLAQTTPG